MNEILRKDQKSSESKVNSLVIDNKFLESVTKQLKETIEKHERSLKQLQSNLIAKQTKLDFAENEKSKFMNTIQLREEELAQIRNVSNEDTDDPNELNLVKLKKSKLRTRKSDEFDDQRNESQSNQI